MNVLSKKSDLYEKASLVIASSSVGLLDNAFCTPDCTVNYLPSTQEVLTDKEVKIVATTGNTATHQIRCKRTEEN